MQSINYQLSVASNFPDENFLFDLKVEVESYDGAVLIHSFVIRGVNDAPLTIPMVIRWMTSIYAGAIREELESTKHQSAMQELLEETKGRIG